MSDDDFAWRVEAACHAAWPTPAETAIAGWLVRHGGGSTRRLNSINPTRAGPRDPAAVIGPARALLDTAGKPLVARVPAIATGLDAALDRLGFGPAESETLTLVAPLAGDGGGEDDPAAILSERPSIGWIAGRCRFAQLDADASRQLVASLDLLPAATRFAAIHAAPVAPGGGHVGAVGFGSIVDGILVLEAIVADPARRRRGHGRALVAALMRWAAREGAAWAALQVVAANAPALALYRGLGFDRDLYRYHYRRV